MRPMHVWPSDGQNSQICTTFPVVKCVFLKSPCQMRTTPFSGSPIHTAAVHFYVSLACAGVYRGAVLFQITRLEILSMWP